MKLKVTRTEQAVVSKNSATQTYHFYSITHQYKDPSTGKWKKVRVASLGSRFDLPEKYWGQFIEMIQGPPAAAPAGLFDDIDKNLQAQMAVRAASVRQDILRKMGKDFFGRDSGREAAGGAGDVSVWVGTARHAAPKSFGAEEVLHLVWNAIGMPEIMRTCGISRKDEAVIEALVIAKAVHPASENETLRWLKESSAVGRLVGRDFSKANNMTLHRAADRFGEIHGQLEELLRRKLSPFQGGVIRVRIDGTNIHFEGKAEKVEKARRGKSKAMRSDAKLVTLALGINEEGYIHSSVTLPGNVSEPTIVADMLAEVAFPKGGMVIMDKGIATASVLEWLAAQGYKYTVASREAKRVFDRSKAARVETDGGSVVWAYREVDPSGEFARIHCWSENRELKDRDVMETRCKKFAEEVASLSEGLKGLRTRKDMGYVRERIGKLKERHGCGRYFRIEVKPSEDDPSRAARILCEPVEIAGSKLEMPGVYSLKTNDLSLETREVVLLYFSLVEIEAVIRDNKQFLGLRPVFHRTGARVDSHMYLSCLAYQMIHWVILKLRAAGIRDCWETVCERLKSRQHVDSAYKGTENDETVLASSCSEPVDSALPYYDALGMSELPRRRRIKILRGIAWDGRIAVNW
jgi:hypothetical protein